STGLLRGCLLRDLLAGLLRHGLRLRGGRSGSRPPWVCDFLVGFVRGPRPATAAGVLTVALTAAERAQEGRASGRRVAGPGGEPSRGLRAGVAPRRGRPAHRADAALGASGGEAGVLRLLIPARSAGGTCSAKPAGGERHRGQCSGDE